jgi:hypothetical protein
MSIFFSRILKKSIKPDIYNRGMKNPIIHCVATLLSDFEANLKKPQKSSKNHYFVKFRYKSIKLQSHLSCRNEMKARVDVPGRKR